MMSFLRLPWKPHISPVLTHLIGQNSEGTEKSDGFESVRPTGMGVEEGTGAPKAPLNQKE